MELSEGIRKLGFRRWYERQLIESHACLVTGLLGVVLVLGSLESLSIRGPGWEPFILLALMLGATGLASWAMYRYLTILFRAQHAGEHSTCSRCGAYGLLEVTGAQAARDEVGVRCRKCGNEWTIG
jgi:hypothetical protein